MAALTLARALGSVDQDGEEPGGNTRATFEAVNAANNAEPGVLDHLFRHALAGNEPAGQAQHARLVGPHQRGERRLVAGAEAFEQLGLLHGTTR